jgi:hypothetical protein
VTNAGTITGAASYGLFSSASLQLANSGLITGRFFGVRTFSNDAPTTVTNTGTITSTFGDGVTIELHHSFGDDLITNSGVISGGQAGVKLNHVGTVSNSGTITGNTIVGVWLNAGGQVTNSGAASSISAVRFGVVVLGDGSVNPVTNAGTIAATGSLGIGVKFVDSVLSGFSNNTLVNGGSIIGVSGTAVQFADGRCMTNGKYA